MATVLSAIGPLSTEWGADLLQQAGVELRSARLTSTMPLEEVAAAMRGCAATIAGSELYTRELFAAVPELRHIARFGVGYDAVDVAAATEAGVLLSTVPGSLDAAVADLAFALMLGVARRLGEVDRAMRANSWSPLAAVDVSFKTLGIIGLGRIGRAVARRARGFEMRLLATEPLPDLAFVREHGVELVPLERLLAESDFVSLHLPLSAETEKFLDAENLSLMRPSAILINTARGGLIDEDALETALAAGRIAGAGLDVRAVEPPLDFRFSRFENVLLAPHVASNTHETRRAMSRMAVDNVLRVLRGERPNGLINPVAWERFTGTTVG